MLTGLLTLFVALFGYRLLFGHTPGVRDGVLALVKIGIVLALATSWPAYRTLVYDVALRGPAELAGDIGAPRGPARRRRRPRSAARRSDRLILALDRARRGRALPSATGRRPRRSHAGPATGVTAPTAPAGATAPFPASTSCALGGARIFFLLGAVGRARRACG